MEEASRVHRYSGRPQYLFVTMVGTGRYGEHVLHELVLLHLPCLSCLCSWGSVPGAVLGAPLFIYGKYILLYIARHRSCTCRWVMSRTSAT